jgi:putative MATE family efflux protein
LSLDKKEMILGGNIYKALLILAFPIMINSLIQTLYSVVDGIWVSKISSVHFAATAFVFPVNFLVISVGIGIFVAGMAILSQMVGAGEEDKARQYTAQFLAISIVTSVFFTIIGVAFTPYIVKWMGATGDIAKYGTTYLRITFLEIPFVFLFFNINAIKSAQGDTVTPTVLSSLSVVLNIVLDPIFIFALNMGIAGAAWATVLSRAALMFYGVKVIFSKENKLKPDFTNFRFDKEIIKEIVKIGLPATIGQAGAAAGFIILNGFVVSYGTATMAAFGMVNRIIAMVQQPAMAIGSALTAVIGQNIGAKNCTRVYESFRKASILSLTLGIGGGLLLIVFSTGIINFFIQSKDDPTVISQGIVYLKYIAFSMPLMGMFSVF